MARVLPSVRNPRYRLWHPGFQGRRRRQPYFPHPDPGTFSGSTSSVGVSTWMQALYYATSSVGASTFDIADIYLSYSTSARGSQSFSLSGSAVIYAQMDASRYAPMSFAEAPTGELYMATGLGPMFVWDGFATSLFSVGIAAPSQAPTLAGSGAGDIVGTYTAYVRFLDASNNPSNLSPVSDAVAIGQSEGTITNVTSGNPPVVTSAAHGLTSGSTVNITGVSGITNINGTNTITVVDADSFSLDSVNGVGTYSGGGSWASGSGSVAYTNVAVPTDPRIVTKQILRNTAGQALVYYVDVETQDLQSTTFTSTNSDSILSAGVSVPLFASDGQPIANRYGVSPTHKAFIVNHQGRMFALGEWEYNVGSVAVTFGSTAVVGIGTEWNQSFVGRFLYVYGSNAAYEIDTVDDVNQTLVLVNTYLGPTNAYADYSIRPAPAERRIIYYNESDTSQAWPATNGFALNEDGDDITGGMSKGSFLYILEKRHIYRETFQVSPVDDGGVFLSSLRGCINNRCWVNVEDATYMLDEVGVHKFMGGDSEPTSLLISDIFRPSSFPLHINWTRLKFFHAAHFPAQETIRWFVCMGGSKYPHHALCYCYRHQRWWIETYPMPICSSSPMLLDYARTIVGGEAQNVYALWGTPLEVADADLGTVRGTVTSSGITWIADSSATFASSRMVGATLCITSGTGKGQTRLIASVSGTVLNVTQPWSVRPDTTSTYQVGGIYWNWRAGAFRYNDRAASAEEDNIRRVEVQFQPTATDCTFDIKIFEDFSETAITWDVTYLAEDGGGIARIKGDAAATVDATRDIGFVQLRTDAHKEINTDGPRWMAVDLSGFSAQDGVSIHGLAIDGVTRGSNG